MASGGKCAVMTKFGGPEVFEIQEYPIPEARPRRSAGPDWCIRRGIC